MAREMTVKQKCGAGSVQFGCFLNMASPIASDIAASVGYDVLLLDHEHGPGTYQDAMACMNAARETNAEVWVRIPSNDQTYIKRILDCGADGIMCPTINTVDDAENLVRFCHYPPRGVRGMAPTLGRHTRYGTKREEYMSTIGERLTIMAQIETTQSVKGIDDIVAVDGIDIFFIGPMDLSAGLGFPGQLDHPAVVEAIHTAENAIKKSGALLSTMVMPNQDHVAMLERGYDLLFSGNDIGFLRTGMQEQVKYLRGLTEARSA